MIRLDANINDMTEQDFIDTIPVIEKELSEWELFYQNTEIASTRNFCGQKMMCIQDRIEKATIRLAVLQTISKIK